MARRMAEDELPYKERFSRPNARSAIVKQIPVARADRRTLDRRVARLHRDLGRAWERVREESSPASQAELVAVVAALDEVRRQQRFLRGKFAA